MDVIINKNMMSYKKQKWLSPKHDVITKNMMSYSVWIVLHRKSSTHEELFEQHRTTKQFFLGGWRTFLTSRAWLLRNLSKRRKSEVQFIQKIGQKRFGVYAIVGLWKNGSLVCTCVPRSSSRHAWFLNPDFSSVFSQTDDGVDAETFLPDFLNKLNFTFASFRKISQFFFVLGYYLNFATWCYWKQNV